MGEKLYVCLFWFPTVTLETNALDAVISQLHCVVSAKVQRHANIRGTTEPSTG